MEKIELGAIPYCALERKINGYNPDTDIDFINKKISLYQKELESMEKEQNKYHLPYVTILSSIMAFIIGYSVTKEENREIIIKTILGNLSDATLSALKLALAIAPITLIGEYLLTKQQKIYVEEQKNELEQLKQIKLELEKIMNYTEETYETTIKTIPIQYYDVKKDNLDYNENDKLRQIREAKQKLVAAKAKLTEAAKQNVTTIPKKMIKKTPKNYRPWT